ncbi:MAG: hypothetical protein NZM42_12945 [Gemmatales bacterium]|nr:hypothetical protein [Gemmatales bacterium]
MPLALPRDQLRAGHELPHFAGLAILLITVIGLLTWGWQLSAQPKPGTLPTPNPQAPVVTSYYPPGGQRGSVVEISLQGRELADALGVLASLPVQANIVPDAKEPASRCVVKLDLPKDSPLGVHALRLVTRRGISNLLPFCVDDLPEVAVTGNNRTVSEAQKITPPCVLTGRIDAEATYYFRVPLQAGQRVCFEVIARRLGSPLDSLLVLQDANGRQVAFSDDAPGLQRDARLIYVAKSSGEYLLQLRDVRYQGGGNYFYRLRVGDFPCATTTFPLSVKRGTTANITFAGPLLDGVPPVALQAPAEPTVLGLLVSPQRPNAPPGWPVILALSQLDEVLEQEPNDSPEQAQRLAMPVAVNGRLEKPLDRDWFRVPVRKGQRMIFEAQTWEYGSPSAVFLTLRDVTGKQQLANSNPMQDPPRLEYNPPADGEVFLTVEHLQYSGGPEETYRVTIQTATPTIRVEALQDRVEVPAGGVGICFVRLTRTDYTGPVRFQAQGGPHLRGEGVMLGEQNVGVVFFQAEPKSPPGAWPLQILAHAKAETGEFVVPVTMTEPLVATFNNLPYPPRHLLTALAASITETPPFLLEAKYGTDRLPRGQTGLEALVRVHRQPGFEDEVQIFAVAPPAAPNQPVALAAPASTKIARGQNEAKLALKLPNNLPTGPLPIVIVGQAKHAGRSYQVYARATLPEIVAGK